MAAQDSISRNARRAGFEQPFVTEEGNPSDIESGKNWIIDPLDGTHNYIAGRPFSGISIGLVEGNDFLLGVIYFPMEHQLYHAVKGKGAYRNGKSIRGVTRKINLECDCQFRQPISSFGGIVRIVQGSGSKSVHHENIRHATMDSLSRCFG